MATKPPMLRADLPGYLGYSSMEHYRREMRSIGRTGMKQGKKKKGGPWRWEPGMPRGGVVNTPGSFGGLFSGKGFLAFMQNALFGAALGAGFVPSALAAIGLGHGVVAASTMIYYGGSSIVGAATADDDVVKSVMVGAAAGLLARGINMMRWTWKWTGPVAPMAIEPAAGTYQHRIRWGGQMRMY